MGGWYGALCALGVAACAFHPGASGNGNGSADAAIADAVDAPPMVDAPAALCASWKPHFFVACSIPAPFGDVHLTSAGSPYTYNTDAATLVDHSNVTTLIANVQIAEGGGITTQLISVSSLTIDTGVELDVTGALPLIVASWGDIAIAGTVDAGSHVGTRTGGGANPASCGTAATAPHAGTDDADAGGGSGGGGGGAFHGNGGLGGPGDNGAYVPNAGGAGGDETAPPQIVRGGCAGAAGGKAGSGAAAPSDANTIAIGGAGGGAIQLTSRTSMTLAGMVLAGGAGGAGAELESAVGGGGGGAGGYVGLEAPTITITGSPTLVANGGGGGGSAPFSGTGLPGSDGPPSSTAAAGGAMSSCSNPGGTGGFGTMVDGIMASQVSASCGGGGGGGGAGFVYVFTPSFSMGGAIISPQASVNPFSS